LRQILDQSLRFAVALIKDAQQRDGDLLVDIQSVSQLLQ